MRYHVIVEREISLAFGPCGLLRRSLLNLLNGLYHNLEGRTEEFRGERHPSALEPPEKIGQLLIDTIQLLCYPLF